MIRFYAFGLFFLISVLSSCQCGVVDVPREEYLAELAKAICETQHLRCCSTNDKKQASFSERFGTDIESCQKKIMNQGAAQFYVSAEGLSYDRSSASACIAAFRNVTCDSQKASVEEFREIGKCSGVFVGKADKDQPCLHTLRQGDSPASSRPCKPGFYCKQAEAGKEGTCQPQKKEGEACTSFVHCDRTALLSCHNGKCVKVRTLGESCTENVTKCEERTVCKAGKCVLQTLHGYQGVCSGN